MLSWEPGCVLTPKSWSCGLSSVTPGQTFLPATPTALPVKEDFSPLAFPSVVATLPAETLALHFQAELLNLQP